MELQNLIKQQEAELIQLAPHFRTRLYHPRGRLLHLTELDPSASDITSVKYQLVRDRLHDIEINLPKMDVAARTNQGNEEEEDEQNNMTQEDRAAPDNPSAEGRQDTGRVCTVTGTFDREVGTLTDQIAPGNAGMVAAQVTSSGHGMKQVFTPHLYQRLSHPLNNLIKELSVVDGTEVKCLYEFLLRVLKVSQVGQMSDSAIYELMYSYCRGELLCLVTQAINAKENFESFHDRVLHLIPVREISDLRWAKVRQNLLKSHANLAKRYNRNRKTVPFKVGDLVYYQNHPVSYACRKITAKLQPRWKGPFKVDKFLTPVTVRFVDPTNASL